jgi:hypothetical protein
MRGQSREDACRARLSAAAGRDLSADEVTELMERVQLRTNERVTAGETFDQAARGAGRDEANDAKIKALVAKRDRAGSVIKMKAALDRIPEGNEHLSLKAMIQGLVRGGRANGLSAAARGRAKADQLKGAFNLEVRRAGLEDKIKQGDPVWERAVFEEKRNIDNPDPARPQPADPTVRKMAEIWARHDETRRLALNQAGAWIGKLDEWGGRQTHDMWKIRSAAGQWSWNPLTGFRRPGGTDADYAAWREVFAPRVGERTLQGIEPEARERYIKELWGRLASGVHTQKNGGDWLGGFKGPGNVAKRLSQERKIFLKDGQAAWEYNQKFGRGSLLESISNTIEHDANNIVQMEMFGTNPEVFIKNLAEKLRERAAKRGDLVVSDGLKESEVQPLIDVMTGKANIPKHSSLAYWAGTIRNVNVVRALGKAFISSFSDIPSNAMMLRRNGIPLFESIPRQLMAQIPGMTSAEKHELGLVMGAWAEGAVSDGHRRWRAEDTRYGAAWSQRASNWMFWLNLQDWENNHLKTDSVWQLAASYAYHQRYAFDQLPARMRATLDRYNNGDAEWQALRKVVTRTEDGEHNLLLPAEILKLPDEAVAHLGPNPERARQTLADQYGTLLNDQVGEGMSDPTIGLRRGMRMGTRPGEAMGVVADAMWQFKSFTASFMQRSVGRELFRGQTKIGSFNVDIPGLVHLMIGVSVFGMFSVMAKDLVQGKDPLSRLGTAAGIRDFIYQSVAQGGGFGILGDILFGANTFGRDFWSSLAGPTASGLNDVTKVFQDLLHGDIKKVPGEVARFAEQWTPYANLFYLDLALRHLFFYGLQEKANPGYLRRMEQKARHDQQRYWLSPTSAVQY